MEKAKIKKLVGWGLGAYEIIMKNKFVISVCLLIQGCFYCFRPMGSLEWDSKILTGLSALYALAGIAVVLSGSNAKAEKGKEIIGKMYHDNLTDKQKKLAGHSEYLSNNELFAQKNSDLEKRAEIAKQKREERTQSFLTGKRWLIIAAYLLLFVLSVVLFIFTDFTVKIVNAVLGIIIAAEGLFSLVMIAKTKDSVKPRGRMISLAVAVFSVALGIVLIILPANTASFVLRLVGAGMILKAITEIFVYIRNRELISSGKETIEQIKGL